MSAQPPWTELHAQLHRTLRSRLLLPQTERLLVAVSGGQDSLCLIKLLRDLQPKWGWELAMVHCDHGWRSDSRANADYVESLAHHWNLPCHQARASEIGKSEAWARQWRYQVLAETAGKFGYSHIVTGHTASDRAETLLYNLIRGSGADGLQALVWRRALPLDSGTSGSQPSQLLSKPLWLVRPLLEMTRTQTEKFCQDQGLRIWQDSTNQDLHYARNRIRQELLPYLQTHFNPQAEHALAQTAELLQAEVEFLEQAAAELYQKALASAQWGECLTEPLTFPVLDRQILREASLALQRRVMRQILYRMLPQAPSFAQIEKLIGLISAPNRSQTDPFPGGLIAVVDHPWIRFEGGHNGRNHSN
ncbi:MAG: tRNA lysidine(34) synthetase TilS [Oscillatoriales cyanobacterium SM2_3_0]|nr:tRNA lysidine(34) synthetase TilS [Oscillatoriales cyanobacterium SM2_3_0]